jgi:hypothetical protein
MAESLLSAHGLAVRGVVSESQLRLKFAPSG